MMITWWIVAFLRSEGTWHYFRVCCNTHHHPGPVSEDSPTILQTSSLKHTNTMEEMLQIILKKKVYIKFTIPLGTPNCPKNFNHFFCEKQSLSLNAMLFNTSGQQGNCIGVTDDILLHQLSNEGVCVGMQMS